MVGFPMPGYLRLDQIIGRKRSIDQMPPLFPISKSTWWAGIKSGRFPTPVKLGPRITAWRAEDIRRLLEDPTRFDR